VKSYMSMVMPTVAGLETLTEEDKQFLADFADIVHKYPQNRTLLFAWIFCAYELGVTSYDLGAQLDCTDRNIRYVVAEVRDSRRGEGKTGRPLSQPDVNRVEEFALVEKAEIDLPVTIGVTRYGGLWWLVPWILSSNLLPYCQWLNCVSVVGTPVQLVLTLFALAVCGLSRIWSLNDVNDRGFALFTGRWVPLRASQVYTWLKCIGQGAVDMFYQGTKVEEWRLVHHYPAILSNDEHVVGHQGGPEMPKGKVSKNGRNMRAHHLFMTFHLAARRFVSLCVTSTKRKLSHVAAPNLREMYYTRQLVGGDDTPIFEILDCGSYSQDAHRELLVMHADGQIEYLTPIRRTCKNVKQWDRGLEWGEYELEPYIRGSEWDRPSEQRHRLCLAHTTTVISGLEQPLPTILIIDLDKVTDPDPKAKYAVVFASTTDVPLWVQADIYSWRQDHELAFRDSLHALGLDAKPKGYQKEHPDLPLDHPDQAFYFSMHRITLLSWIRALAFNRVRDLLDHLHEPAPSWTVLTAARKLIRRTALLQVQGGCFWVIFDPFPDDHVLAAYCAWVNVADFAIPWLNSLKLRLAIAERPIGETLPSARVRKLLFDP
jgi:ribosomal protein L32